MSPFAPKELPTRVPELPLDPHLPRRRIVVRGLRFASHGGPHPVQQAVPRGAQDSDKGVALDGQQQVQPRVHKHVRRVAASCERCQDLGGVCAIGSLGPHKGNGPGHTVLHGLQRTLVLRAHEVGREVCGEGVGQEYVVLLGRERDLAVFVAEPQVHAHRARRNQLVVKGGLGVFADGCQGVVLQPGQIRHRLHSSPVDNLLGRDVGARGSV
mmetsp:Transcript_13939/g.23601  ORF Transcript_13939/g.23601 Transcript_13939/m.23601 type:complete len:212 (+) Transcript_13939:261-896(+)